MPGYIYLNLQSSPSLPVHQLTKKTLF